MLNNIFYTQTLKDHSKYLDSTPDFGNKRQGA